MNVCVFCFAVGLDGATASLNLNLDFRRDASNCGFIWSAFLAGVLSGRQQEDEHFCSCVYL